MLGRFYLPLFIENPMKHIFFDLDGTLHKEDIEFIRLYEIFAQKAYPQFADFLACLSACINDLCLFPNSKMELKYSKLSHYLWLFNISNGEVSC